MKRLSNSWAPPAWLEPAFIGIAFTVAVVAFATLILWLLITFVVPFHIYSRETGAIALDNGQTLQITYPNLVLAGDTPAYIILALRGTSNATDPAAFMVEIPSGLTVVEPVEQAQSDTVKLIAPGRTEPAQMKIGVVNSRSARGALLFVRQPAGIRSTAASASQRIEIGVETTSWAAARGIVSNTINERSTLILLVTGFLSGAGTLILQYMKTHRDRLHEDRKQQEERFYKLMQEDFEAAINVFLRNGEKSVNPDDFVMYKTLIEQTNWYYRLSANVREKLKQREFAEAMRAVKTLKVLCELISKAKGEEDIELQSLYRLCELASISERRDKLVSTEDAQSLLTAYQNWKELGPLVTDLIQDFSHAPENLFLLYNVLQDDKQGAGRKLLENSNLQHVIREWKTETLSAGEMETLQAIKNMTAYSLHWRDIQSGKERKLSDKVQRWLSEHWYESGPVEDNISLESEFAELDNKLMSVLVEHVVFKKLDGSFPAILFGDEGMGKTASALWLVDRCQRLAKANTTEPKIFPVYAPFESGVDTKEWVVERVSRALVDFVADNPRHFINAPESQKTAMTRLMLRHLQTLDELHLHFYSSPVNNAASDMEQALEYIANVRYRKPKTKLTKEEMLYLLYMAKPDIFDQVYFLWDIRSATPEEDVISSIKAIEGLILPLAMQNFYFKIFAPAGVAEKLKEIPGFRYPERVLIWNGSLLRQLIESRIKMFDALWERGIDDPAELVIATAGRSPRQVIRFLIQMLDYIDEHLQEGKKLNMSIFSQQAVAQPEERIDVQQNQQRSMSNYEHGVFVSYAWGGESERTVNDLEEAFARNDISIIRDKKDLNYKGSILEFERRIGQGQCIILVISDKYLRSEHCMYELLIMDENRNLHDRIFPIVLADANIYSPMDRLQYIGYWDEQIEKLNRAIKNDVNVMTNLSGILAELEKYVRIRASFDHLSSLLSDMNALTPEIHAAHGFSTIIREVKNFITDNPILKNQE